MRKLSVVGRVSKLFGLDGGLAINLYDTFPADINLEEPLFVYIDELAVPLFINKFERRGKHGALVTFDDIDNTTRATELLRMELMADLGNAPEKELPTEGEIFWEDMVGFRVRIYETLEDGSISEPVEGVVSGFIESDMNPLFSIELDSTEILIPASEDFIDSLDIDNREVELNLPEGLLSLYI